MENQRKSNKQILTELMDDTIESWKRKGTEFSYEIKDQVIQGLPFGMTIYQVAVQLTGKDSKGKPSCITLMKDHKHVDPLLIQTGTDPVDIMEEVYGKLITKIGEVSINTEDFEQEEEIKKLKE